MVIYFVIYLALFALGIHSYKHSRQLWVILVCAMLVCFAGFRAPEVSGDYINYIDFFKNIKGSAGLNFIAFVEPSFVLFSFLLPSLRWVVLLYALLGVLFKVYGIKNLTPFAFLSFALWFSNYFLVQEMNQIRAGVAIGLLLLSIPYIVNRNLCHFSLLVALATMFHYSALVFFPLYFLNSKKIPPFYFVFIPLAYLLHAGGIGFINILNHIPIAALHSKLEAYNYLYSIGLFTEISLYSPVIMFRLIILYILLSKWKTLQTQNRYTVVLLKSAVLSIALLILFSGLPVFSIRISEIFASAEIILLPFLLYLYRPSYAVVLFLFLIGLLLLCDNLFYRHFVNRYTFSL